MPHRRRRCRQNAAGDIIVTYKDDVSTLDPAIGYDWQNWSIIKSLFDGLMDYEPGTTDARARPRRELRDHRRRKDFHLQAPAGVKFHNGREVTADDVKYSIERVLDPATQSPGAGFFGSIATITVVDPLTIKFDLSRPDATFLHVMAINFAHVVPKEAVDEFGADFGITRSAPAPSSSAEWTLGQRLVFEKNADYWKEGVPYLDSSPSSSATSRPSRFSGCRRARSTCSATAFPRHSSSRSRTIRNTKAGSSKAGSSTPAT